MTSRHLQTVCNCRPNRRREWRILNETENRKPHGITVTVTDPATGATVKYGTTAGAYTIDASPTQTEAGTLTVYYQVTADNYTAYAGSATVTIGQKLPKIVSIRDNASNSCTFTKNMFQKRNNLSIASARSFYDWLYPLMQSHRHLHSSGVQVSFALPAVLRIVNKL